MKTSISTRLLHPLKSTLCNRRPHAVTIAAETELSALLSCGAHPSRHGSGIGRHGALATSLCHRAHRPE